MPRPKVFSRQKMDGEVLFMNNIEYTQLGRSQNSDKEAPR